MAVLTENDMVNIETGIILQEMLGAAPGAECSAGYCPPIVLRIYDRELGAAVGHRLGFEHVRSTVDLATPWFIGAAMGLEVLGTFSVGQHSFMIGGVQVQEGRREWTACNARAYLPRRGSSLSIAGMGGQVRFHPHRDARLSAGDTAYLVGPYRELLETLRRGQRASQPGKIRRRATRTG